MPNTTITVPGVPFPLTASQPEVWTSTAEGGLVADAPARTDLYVDPGGGADDASAVLNAATLVGTPPPGDFQLDCRVQVDFGSQFDAGVLLVWIDGHNWAKFCFEYSPASQPMVVSVVTRGLSDDANAFVLGEDAVSLRISRVDGVYAFHASTDGHSWQLVRVFSLGADLPAHRLGFEAQSPTGEGCRVTFDAPRFSRRRLLDLRDGS